MSQRKRTKNAGKPPSAAPASRPTPHTSISHCTFTGVRWDQQSVTALSELARALQMQADANKQNSAAITRAFELFRSMGAGVPLVHVGDGKVTATDFVQNLDDSEIPF